MCSETKAPPRAASSSSSLERDALALATNGFRVLPITPGSKCPPLIKRFSERATDDPCAVAEFWRQWPTANVGVATGRGLVAIDCDNQAAKRYVAGLELPDTTSVRTPRGGFHLYFRSSLAPNRPGVRPGLDLRGDGGYCVGANSRVGSSVYEWIIPPWELAPVQAPDQLERLLAERPKGRPLGADPIFRGERNATLVRHAGVFVRAGVQGAALDAALRAMNAERCRPPLLDREIEKLIRQAHGWARPPSWALDPFRSVEGSDLSTNARLLYLTLVRRVDKDHKVRGGYWVESVTGLSERQKANATRELEDKGWVSVVRGTGKGQANMFTFLSPPTAYQQRGSKGLSNQQVMGEGR